MRRRVVSALLVALAPLALPASGCVRVYQPMSNLHRPVVIDPRLPNFEGLALTVRCVPEGLLNAEAASVLCQRVGSLFEVQGAAVTTTTDAFAAAEPDFAALPGLDAGEGDAAAVAVAAPGGPRFTLELRARQTHRSNNLLSAVLCAGTLTMVPAISEATFAQDVQIRDESGFLLAAETLEGRMVARFGFGAWAGNGLMDWLVRGPDEDLTQDALDRTISADIYGQLSQTLFNAQMQWEIRQQLPAAPLGRRSGG